MLLGLEHCDTLFLRSRDQCVIPRGQWRCDALHEFRIHRVIHGQRPPPRESEHGGFARQIVDREGQEGEIGEKGRGPWRRNAFWACPQKGTSTGSP